jgi:uncharacterized protein (TIGR01627 family)
MNIENLMKINKNNQMTKEEYIYISCFLSNVNFLVFGTGNDSDYWRTCNNKGYTIFLENKKQWIDPQKNDIMNVKYTSRLSEYKKLLNEYKNKQYNNLIIDIPSKLYKIEWDCILVDSPEGWGNKCPGRMQSIFMASKLAKEKTNIFIHDCNREVENIYSKEMFSKEIKMLKTLRHVML